MRAGFAEKKHEKAMAEEKKKKITGDDEPSEEASTSLSSSKDAACRGLPRAPTRARDYGRALSEGFKAMTSRNKIHRWRAPLHQHASQPSPAQRQPSAAAHAVSQPRQFVWREASSLQQSATHSRCPQPTMPQLTMPDWYLPPLYFNTV